MKIRFVPPAIILILTVSTLIIAQQTFVVTGTVKRPDKSPIVAMTLHVDLDGKMQSIYTDENGAFKVELPPGNYTLTASELVYKNFAVNIMVPENGLVPKNVELIAEPILNWCSNCLDDQMPKTLRAPWPRYSPTAYAKGAGGEVVLEIDINSNGNVISAKAVSGHHLLLIDSEKAAMGWKFSEDSAVPSRKAILIFAFSRDDRKENKRSLKGENRLEIPKPYYEH